MSDPRYPSTWTPAQIEASERREQERAASAELEGAAPAPGMALANRIAIIARGLSYNDGQREAQAKHMLFEIVSTLGGTGLAASPVQGGLTNDKLREAWNKKLPGVEPKDRELTAFALGVEVGFDHSRTLERQDWDRVHHALKDAGVHPGRTDDHLADVIARALASLPAAPLSDDTKEN